MMITLGVDVSKSFLDVADSISKSARRFDNTNSGIADLFNVYADYPVQDLRIVIESTGHYQYRLQHAAFDLGALTYVVNPYRMRQFSHAVGKMAKTDRIDARIICQFGQTMDLKSMFKRSANELMLGDLLKTRTCLKTQIVTLNNRKRLINPIL